MQPSAFSREELARYSRHLIIPEFNIEGQKRLKKAKVLVVGSGGLGTPLLLYLTAAGIGTIGIVDFDVVDNSNLQRQVLFTTEDVGKPKATTAATRLKALNPHVQFIVHNTQLNIENALNIVKNYDVVADGTDNFPTRYLINDACLILNKPNIYGAIFRFEGQASVFNYTDKTGNKGPNYRDLFPSPPLPETVPDCAEGGVLGVLPGIIGSIQANELIKVIAQIGEPLSGRLLLFDALNFQTRIIKLKPSKQTSAPTQLINYENFCGIKSSTSEEKAVKEISPKEVQQMIAAKQDLQLIDVREAYEYEITHLNGTLIPIAEIIDAANKISTDKKVVIHCRTGLRSAKAIRQLQKQYGFTNLYNLTGGILAWAEQVDNTLPKY